MKAKPKPRRACKCGHSFRGHHFPDVVSPASGACLYCECRHYAEAQKPRRKPPSRKHRDLERYRKALIACAIEAAETIRRENVGPTSVCQELAETAFGMGRAYERRE